MIFDDEVLIDATKFHKCPKKVNEAKRLYKELLLELLFENFKKKSK